MYGQPLFALCPASSGGRRLRGALGSKPRDVRDLDVARSLEKLDD
jgi:hypothetical protein